MDKAQALEILHTHVKNQNLVRHNLAVGVVMKSLAQKLAGNQAEWEVLGLIHDSDWEETKDQPDQHTRMTLDRLSQLGYSGALTHALMSHNAKLTGLATLEGPMEWALECCDELTGFIVACALILPSKKLADVTVESVIKKFSQKSFAAAVDRDQIAQCEKELGIPLPEFVGLALSAMQSIALEIGL